MNYLKRRPLSLAISLLSLSGTAAFAQAEDASVTDSQQVIEEVVAVASPIRDSQAAAIDAKRNADNTVDVISADTIGRFPDQNLADSLGRLPGLAIERDQGQARYINFRGAPFRYTKIAIDGIDVPGAENGRTPRFDSFPSAITSRIEANKAIMPNMPGEAVAGYINIETFDPFSQDGLSLAADIGTGKQELGDGDVSKYSFRTSWSGDHFGMVAYASHNEREQITDNREYDLDNDNGTLGVNTLEFRNYKVKREDSAHGAKFEYRGDGVVQRAYFNTLYSEFIDHEERNQFVFDLTDANGTSGQNIETSVSRSLEYGKYQTSTRSHTLGADMVAGDWMLTPSITSTKTDYTFFLPIITSAGATTTADYDLSDIEDPLLILADDLSSLTYAYSYGLPYAQQLKTEETKYKLDAERDITLLGQPSLLSLGTQYDQRKGRGYTASYAVGGLGDINIDDYNTGNAWDSNTTNYVGGTYYDNKGLRSAWEATGNLSKTIADTNRIYIDEDIFAVYAMATTEMGWGNFTFGSRIEQTRYSSEGTMDSEHIKAGDDYTHVLPSIHVNVDVDDDLKFRASATTGISRPNYSEWRASIAVDSTEQEASGGNPELKPEEAMGFDTSLEWYFSPASLLSAGAFYRTIDHVIYASTEDVDGGRFVATEAGESWEYTSYFNGSDGVMHGVEFNFMGSLENGLGASANAAFVNSEFKDQDGNQYDLPGTSDTIYNASLFYENYGFSARVNYMFRSEWISPIEDPSEVWGDQERVDMSLSYELPYSAAGETSSVYFNANNLTNETDNRYAGNGTINQSESYGRSYLLGLRLNY